MERVTRGIRREGREREEGGEGKEVEGKKGEWKGEMEGEGEGEGEEWLWERREREEGRRRSIEEGERGRERR